MTWQAFLGIPLVDAAARSAPFVFAFVVVLWLFSIRLKDVSIIDTWFAVIMTGAVALAAVGGHAPAGRKLLVLALMGVWCLRITSYLYQRKRGQGEDPRYTKLRGWVADERAFAWYSLRVVFLFQGLVFVLATLPAQFAVTVRAPDAQPVFAWIGATIWLIGFVFEVVGDWQLVRFRRNPGNRGRVLARGLWRFTRHPNYFGEIAMAWAYFIIALENPLALITLVGPLVYTYIVVAITGKRTLEKKLAKEKPGYADYMRRTSGLFPWFPQPAPTVKEEN
jgi:steroid 5-alpha reductase family enzyme